MSPTTEHLLTTQPHMFLRHLFLGQTRVSVLAFSWPQGTMMEKGLEGTRLHAPKPCSVNLLARAHCAELVYGYWSKFPIIRGPIYGFPL